MIEPYKVVRRSITVRAKDNSGEVVKEFKTVVLADNLPVVGDHIAFLNNDDSKTIVKITNKMYVSSRGFATGFTYFGELVDPLSE